MYIGFLIALLLLAIFFSLSETAMMAVNRYRLRYLSRKSQKNATRVLQLLERPDRLLVLVLIWNTFANIFISAIVAILALEWYGKAGVFVFTTLLSFFLLIVGEIAPKTVAALHSQRVALAVSGPLTLLLKISYPIVWFVNGMANGLLRLVGMKLSTQEGEKLSIEELRSIVNESSTKKATPYQKMLLGVLDLQQITVEEVMVPKNDIYGIDLTESLDTIVKKIRESVHMFFPVYEEHIDKIKGILSQQKALLAIADGAFNLETVLTLLEEPYFIPESVKLYQQLLNFQKEKKSLSLVVDEYGAIQGMLTLQDLISEITGDIAYSSSEMDHLIIQEKDSVLIDASINLRDLNRIMGYTFPVDGPRTLSGLIIDYLESIPPSGICIRLQGYKMEIMAVSSHTVEQVRVYV